MHLYLKLLSFAQISNAGTAILINDNMEINIVHLSFHPRQCKQCLIKLIYSRSGVHTKVADDDDDDVSSKSKQADNSISGGVNAVLKSAVEVFCLQ